MAFWPHTALTGDIGTPQIFFIHYPLVLTLNPTTCTLNPRPLTNQGIHLYDPPPMTRPLDEPVSCLVNRRTPGKQHAPPLNAPRNRVSGSGLSFVGLSQIQGESSGTCKACSRLSIFHSNPGSVDYLKNKPTGFSDSGSTNIFFGSEGAILLVPTRAQKI